MEMLLNNGALQAELKIGPEQLQHLKSIVREFQFRQYDLLQQLRDPKKASAARAALEAHMEMGRAMIARVLNRRQLDRFQQIMMQVGGVCMAVRDESVSLALSVDPSQMRRISTSCQRMMQVAEPIPPHTSTKDACAAMERSRKSYEAARAQLDDEVATILSEGQLASLRAMEGEPFKMAPPTPPPECR